MRNDRVQLSHAFCERRWTGLKDERGFDFIDTVGAACGNVLPAVSLANDVPFHWLAAPGTDDDLRVPRNDYRRMEDSILRALATT